jgi:hypothetical protein
MEDYLKKVRESTWEVVKKSKRVKISLEDIEKLTKEWIKNKIRVPLWDKKHHFKGEEEKVAFYFFILDSINFSFFPEKGKQRWHLKLGKEKINGYFALALSLKKATKSYPFFDIGFWENMEEKTLNKMLNGKGEIPLFKERLNILKENAKILKERFKGDVVNLIKKAKNQASLLVYLLVSNFPSFSDVSVYKKEKVYFLKRAQIFVADLYGALDGKGLGYFKDIDKLTAFSDYKLPQILNHFKILKYDKILEEKIRKKEEIKRGSMEEVEIRANTIWAVEFLKKSLSQKGENFYSFEIDWILWNLSQRKKLKLPHHRTRTIFY